MEWLKKEFNYFLENLIYILIFAFIFALLFRWIEDGRSLQNIFAKYSDDHECELRETAKLGYEPKSDDRWNIKNYCWKYR